MGHRLDTGFARAMSLIAVFVALSAGAYAAGLAKNSVKSKQIKDGAVQSQDLKDGAVSGGDVADGSLTGADVADDSLNEADVAEGTLQGVVAANADSVGGLQVKEIDFQTAFAPGVVRSILDFTGTFRIDAQCSNVGDGLDLTAFTAVANSRISMVGTRAVGADDSDAGNLIEQTASQDNVFNPNEAFQIDNNLPSISSAHTAVITFSTLQGFNATVHLYSAELGGGCKVVGTAVGG